MTDKTQPNGRTEKGSGEKVLSHVDSGGKASMVDVSHKAATARRAVATGKITMSREALAAIRENQIAKGDVLGVARIAGVLAAKKTADLIPLCHPLPLTDIQIRLELSEPLEDASGDSPALPCVVCRAEVRTMAQTGVEMEALTAVSVALLTVYDMAKSVDKEMRIEEVFVVEKER